MRPFHETALWITCPGQRGGDRREKQATQTQQSLPSVQEDRVLFFVFPTTFLALALLFDFFLFSPGIGSDQFRSAAFFSPSMTFSPLTGAPGLGLCRRMALACLLQKQPEREAAAAASLKVQPEHGAGHRGGVAPGTGSTGGDYELGT